ncbi:hypothetical protein ABS71_14600 [bacterium SCN 62-11]|nr:MAG: hypothetical protein ABS71_14600 [bacterium SCN 62-11]
MDSLRNAINQGRNIRQVQVPQNNTGGARKSQNAPTDSQLTAHPRNHAPEDRVTLTQGPGGLRYHVINGHRFYH